MSRNEGALVDSTAVKDRHRHRPRRIGNIEFLDL